MVLATRRSGSKSLRRLPAAITAEPSAPPFVLLKGGSCPTGQGWGGRTTIFPAALAEKGIALDDRQVEQILSRPPATWSEDELVMVFEWANREFRPAMERYARAVCPHDYEDRLQDAFLSAFRYVRSFTIAKTKVSAASADIDFAAAVFRAWLWAIVRNRLKGCRSPASGIPQSPSGQRPSWPSLSDVHRHLPLLAPLAAEAAFFRDVVAFEYSEAAALSYRPCLKVTMKHRVSDARHTLGHAYREMANLTVEVRQAVVLCYMQHRSDAEIATISGCTIGTAMSRLQSGCRQLGIHHDRGDTWYSGT